MQERYGCKYTNSDNSSCHPVKKRSDSKKWHQMKGWQSKEFKIINCRLRSQQFKWSFRTKVRSDGDNRLGNTKRKFFDNSSCSSLADEAGHQTVSSDEWPPDHYLLNQYSGGEKGEDPIQSSTGQMKTNERKQERSGDVKQMAKDKGSPCPFNCRQGKPYVNVYSHVRKVHYTTLVSAKKSAHQLSKIILIESSETEDEIQPNNDTTHTSAENNTKHSPAKDKTNYSLTECSEDSSCADQDSVNLASNDEMTSSDNPTPSEVPRFVRRGKIQEKSS